MTYQPSYTILKKYADVLVKFALRSGEGIKPGEVVLIEIPESAKPMLIPLQKSVLEAGGHPIIEYIPEGIMRDFFEDASDEQINFWAKKRSLGTIEDITHRIRIIAEADKHELKSIDSRKLMARVKARKNMVDAMFAKENEGRLTWTLCLYGTESMAQEAGLTLEEYWQEIENACFLDFEDPIAKWQEVFAQVEQTKEKLTTLPIEKVHIVGEDVDLHVQIGTNRQWLGGSGRNIPSFEVFTSPDWRGTNGRIRFSEPLYRYGSLITGIELHFENGIITKASAKENEQMLLDMIAVEGANKIGEFSLTDRRTSRITKFMAETLYDENVGGPYGNTHIAIGMAYKDAYKGNIASTQTEEWEAMGFNDSAVHTDIVSTSNRKVTATLSDGSEIVIYTNGEFVI